MNPHYILQPAKGWFIALSLVVAFLFNLIPWGQLAGVPDLIALVLLFWNIHQPRKAGMGIAFLLGLLMDAHHGSLLGEHALAYTILSYGAITIHRRVLWSPLFVQALYVLPLLVLTQAILFAIHLIAGANFPGWSYLTNAFVEAALWPLATFILLAPQKRPVDPDDTRPI